MAELSIIYSQQCKFPYAMEVEGSTGNVYTVSGLVNELPQCTCKAFIHRHRCKHIRMAFEQICGWHKEYSDEVQTEVQERDRVCPRCNKETEVIKVGV